jgi:hypothetical protein
MGHSTVAQLLMAHDRTEGNDFPMTHEFLSLMLGMRRPGVTVAALALQKAELIRYRRGGIEITDRLGLEAVTCECYGVARRAYDSQIGPPAEATWPYWR